MNRLPLALLGAALLLLTGCETGPIGETADDEGIYAIAVQGDQASLRLLESSRPEDRADAICALGVLAAEAARNGNTAVAARRTNILIRHFSDESAPAVRSLIVESALVAANVRTPAVRNFLRARLTEADCLTEAIRAYAALFPQEAGAALRPFLDHPRFEIRLEAARALIDCGSPDAAPSVRALIENMDRAPWPARVHGVPTPAIQESLRARLQARRPASARTPPAQTPVSRLTVPVQP